MIYLEMVDHDAEFMQLRNPPIIANTLNTESLEDKRKLNNLVYKRYEGDSLNVVPTCGCDEPLEGAFNVGVRCDNCGGFCHYPLEESLESLIWMKAPVGVATLISPVAWIILSTAMSTSGFNLLEHLTNPSYVPPGKKLPKALVGKVQRLELMMKENGLERGLNCFYNNFDQIFEMAYSLRGLVKEPEWNKEITTDIYNWVKQNRNKIFCQHLPMPSKVGFVVEAGPNVTFIDKTITLAIDALRTLISIENGIRDLSPRQRQVRTVQTIKTLAEYYEIFVNETLGKKQGIFRKHIFGGSVHFSARAVISSLTENHAYDEIHLPWSLALQLFKVHLTNKLLKLGKTVVEIDQLLRLSALRYDPLLDRLLKELIAESPHGGIPATFGRNPTLSRGSIQLFYITKVKTDVSINTISLSVLCLKSPNADWTNKSRSLAA